jgi:hypothetical protein
MAVDGSLPLSLEVTFVHRSIETRPVTPPSRSGAPLDAPNDPRRPDYVIDLRSEAVSEMTTAFVVV